MRLSKWHSVALTSAFLVGAPAASETGQVLPPRFEGKVLRVEASGQSCVYAGSALKSCEPYKVIYTISFLKSRIFVEETESSYPNAGLKYTHSKSGNVFIVGRTIDVVKDRSAQSFDRGYNVNKSAVSQPLKFVEVLHVANVKKNGIYLIHFLNAEDLSRGVNMRITESMIVNVSGQACSFDQFELGRQFLLDTNEEINHVENKPEQKSCRVVDSGGQ